MKIGILRNRKNQEIEIQRVDYLCSNPLKIPNFGAKIQIFHCQEVLERCMYWVLTYLSSVIYWCALVERWLKMKPHDDAWKKWKFLFGSAWCRGALDLASAQKHHLSTWVRKITYFKYFTYFMHISAFLSVFCERRYNLTEENVTKMIVGNCFVNRN